MSIADEIEKLNNLKNSGAISEEEFQEAKRKLLQGNPSAGEMFDQAIGSVDEKTWAMLIHLSVLLFFIIPVFGLAVPIIMWQLKKNSSPFIDATGKMVTNWIITALAISIVMLPFCLIMIGFAMLALLAGIAIFFAIYGGIKANNGELWPYPLAYQFIK